MPPALRMNHQSTWRSLGSRSDDSQCWWKIRQFQCIYFFLVYVFERDLTSVSSFFLRVRLTAAGAINGWEHQYVSFRGGSSSLSRRVLSHFNYRLSSVVIWFCERWLIFSEKELGFYVKEVVLWCVTKYASIAMGEWYIFMWFESKVKFREARRRIFNWFWYRYSVRKETLWGESNFCQKNAVKKKTAVSMKEFRNNVQPCIYSIH
jgi:hypothetical protein